MGSADVADWKRSSVVQSADVAICLAGADLAIGVAAMSEAPIASAAVIETLEKRADRNAAVAEM